MGISWSRPALMEVLWVAPQSLITQPLHGVFHPLLGLRLEEAKQGSQNRFVAPVWRFKNWDRFQNWDHSTIELWVLNQFDGFLTGL